ncbi:L-ribulose-5-phosphate 3-epimerase [Flavobacterium phage vB_FspP_elemoA_11-9C]|nr:L-ribulose-5-phosphate 3-epimerase [Flavobacterium phage vB_FspP_elemoA_11-9C]
MDSINFLKNKEGRYLNFKDMQKTYYVDSFINATPIPNIKDVIKLAEHFKLEVKSVDVEVFKTEYSKIVSKILVVGELLYRELNRYNDDLPVIPGLNKHVRNAVRNASDKLKAFHKLSDSIVATGKDELFFEASGDFEELMNCIVDGLEKDTMKDLVKKLKKKTK